MTSTVHYLRCAVNDIFGGLSFAYLAFSKSFENPKLLYRLKGHLARLSVFLLVLYSVTFIPLSLLHSLLCRLFRLHFLNSAFDAAHALLMHMILEVPLLGLNFLRYVYSAPLDAVFFASLSAISVPYSDALQRHPKKAFAKQVAEFWVRYGRRLRLGVALLVLSHLPLIGPLVVPTAQFLICAKVFGIAFAVASSVLLMVVASSMTSASGLSLAMLLGMRSLGRELLEPFLCRVRLEPDEKRRLFAASEMVLLGFTLPFWLLLNVPLLGPLAFAFAQVGAADLLVAMLARTFPRDGPDDVFLSSTRFFR